MKVTGAQIRAARAFLRWTIADLAKAANIGSSTVQALEATDGVPTIKGGFERTMEHREAVRNEAIAKVKEALEATGITFLPANAQGVGLRGSIES
jgi:ribosome-binding protein aMBF1 (putative translation factor)